MGVGKGGGGLLRASPPESIRGGALHLPATRFCARPFTTCNKILSNLFTPVSRDSTIHSFHFASAILYGFPKKVHDQATRHRPKTCFQSS